MGSVILALWLCLSAWAAPRVAMVVAQEPATIGAPVWIEVATTEGAVPASDIAPQISVSSGTVSEMVLVRPGRWRAQVISGSQESLTVRAVWEGQRAEETVIFETFPEAVIAAPSGVDGLVGAPIDFAVTAADGALLEANDLRVEVADGSTTSSCLPEVGCTITWTPGGEPYPRAVPIFIHDKRHPIHRPLVVVGSLSARPAIPVQTEVGAKVTLMIGDREYGPETAGPDGRVRFSVTVHPGETEAVAELEDRLGNRQKSTILLGASKGFTLGLTHQGSIIQGGLPPVALVAVVSPRGRLVSDSPPECTGLVQSAPFAVGDGLWGGHVASPGGVDQRVACRFRGSAESSVVVRVERSRATRLVVQSYPTQLSADLPLAEVQAYLLNGVGERLPVSGLHVEAEIGMVRLDGARGEPLIRGRYDGTKATMSGQDLVTASWRRPKGTGGIWDLAIRVAAPGDGSQVLIDARAVDQGGRPVEGVAVDISIGSNRKTVQTGPGGWATATHPWTPGAGAVAVSVSADGLTRRSIVLRGDPAGAAVGRPDLVTELLIPIRAGRVHGLVLNTQPRVLTNDGMVGQIEVYLEDKLGNLITGPDVEISATAGVVGEAQLRGTGKFVATYAPPIGMAPGPVRLTATTKDGLFSASTDVEVVHRQLDWSLGANAGVMSGARGLLAVKTSLVGEARTPFSGLYGRADLMYYRLRAESVDPVTRDLVSVHMDVGALSVGGVARGDFRRMPVWAGGGLLIAPYRINASAGEQTSSEGWGWLTPGAMVVAGIGTRVWGGELYGELQYLFLSGPGRTYGWNGAIGGVVGAIGFKVLY